MQDINYKKKMFELLMSKTWRLNNLYRIVNDQGQDILFEPSKRPAQTSLLNNPHPRIVVIKARQLGVSTYYSLNSLDICLFVPNISAVIISDTMVSSKLLMESKIRYAYDRLPEFIKEQVQIVYNNKTEMTFSNGSSIRCCTSCRGATVQVLHISELAKICNVNPLAANEIKNGSLNAVAAKNTLISLESTAMGANGLFYDMVKDAERLEHEGKKLSPLEYKLHFFPWFDKVENRVESNVIIPAETQDYFKKIESQTGRKLSIEQQRWYHTTYKVLQEAMGSEHPSTIEECFLSSSIGSYYIKQMAQLRKEKRLTGVLHSPDDPVYSAWDLGISDSMAIIIFQVIGDKVSILDYIEGSGEGISHYINIMKSKPYKFNTHYAPFDIARRDLLTGRSRIDRCREMGFEFEMIPQTKSVIEDINYIRSQFFRIHIHAENCQRLISCLDNYSKTFCKQSGLYLSKPRHDEYSDGADAFRYMIMSLKMINESRGQNDFQPFPDVGGGNSNWMS